MWLRKLQCGEAAVTQVQPLTVFEVVELLVQMSFACARGYNLVNHEQNGDHHVFVQLSLEALGLFILFFAS